MQGCSKALPLGSSPSTSLYGTCRVFSNDEGALQSVSPATLSSYCRQVIGDGDFHGLPVVWYVILNLVAAFA